VTLIAGVLTDEYVALISDMRVTRLAGGRIISQEDTDAKSIVLGGEFLMGFTGLARIDGLRIEAWISPVLDGVPTENYFEVLRQKIEEAFLRVGQAGRIPHAFLAVGYGSLEPGEAVQPLSVTISNSFDAAGTFSPGARVSMQFGISVEKLGNRRQLVTCAATRCTTPRAGRSRNAYGSSSRAVRATRRSLSGRCLQRCGTLHGAAAATSAGPRSSRACLGARCRSG